MTNPAIEQPTDSATLDKELAALRVARKLLREEEAGWDKRWGGRGGVGMKNPYREADWTLDLLMSRLSLASLRLKLGG